MLGSAITVYYLSNCSLITSTCNQMISKYLEVIFTFNNYMLIEVFDQTFKILQKGKHTRIIPDRIIVLYIS